MKPKGEIKNARITSTFMGREDHGIFTIFLYLDYGSGQQGFGGYALDEYDKVKEKRVPHVTLAEHIFAILETVGVEKWEDLPGKYIRADASHVKIHGIGNLLQEKWFYPGKED